MEDGIPDRVIMDGSESQYQHEEADVTIVLYVKEAIGADQKTMVVVTDDTEFLSSLFITHGNGIQSNQFSWDACVMMRSSKHNLGLQEIKRSEVKTF